MGKKFAQSKNRGSFRQATLHEFSSPPRSGLSSSRKEKGHKPAVSDNSDSDESHVGSIRFESNTSEDDDIPIGSSPRKRKARVVSSDDGDSDGKSTVSIPCGDGLKINQRTKRQRMEEESDEEERVEIQVVKRKARLPLQPTDGGSDEEEPRNKPRRRLLRKRSESTRKEEAESEDNEDLAAEVDEEHIIEDRLRQRDKKSTFQKNLEKLKKRKMKQPKQSESTDTNNSEESDNGNISDKPFSGAKPTDSLRHSDDELESPDEDENFIVEDDGAVEQAVLPVEFSMETHQDLGHHFKIIFQFFVHIAVQPPRKREKFMEKAMRDNRYFSIPLQTARRKITGLRDSLVASSVWRPEFKDPLTKYPHLEINMLDFALPGCSACHLGGRLSSRIGYLTGRPYNTHGFEPLDDLSDEDDEEDEGSPKPRHEFPLGRFCAKRCEIFHSMCHWEYDLFRAILLEVDVLKSQRAGKGFVQVSHVHGKRPPEDLSKADEIMDWLDDRQIVEREWKAIKNLMKDARDLEYATKRGDTDDQV